MKKKVRKSKKKKKTRTIEKKKIKTNTFLNLKAFNLSKTKSVRLS